MRGCSATTSSRRPAPSGRRSESSLAANAGSTGGSRGARTWSTGARSTSFAVDGALSALAALFIAGTIFGMDLPWPQVLAAVPITAVVALASYCFGTFLAGIVFRFRNINSLVVLTTHVSLMAACGVNVPLSYYPEALEWFSRVLPVTNGLLAIRGVLDGTDAATILGYTALEAAVAVGWMTLALASFNQLAARGRRDGSLDYGA
ncbi:MAG TPA: ABC transporter permease [Gaiellaceae bacterium]|nr:ABC transporter permease [Gaiellaceae bacterium]